MRSAQKTDVNEPHLHPSSSTNPTSPYFSSLQQNESSNSIETTKKESRNFSSLPRTFISRLPHWEQNAINKEASVNSSPSEKSLESIGGKRGKLIQVRGLNEGLRQLRCLLQLTAPGLTPEETVVAAMLDLVSYQL